MFFLFCCLAHLASFEISAILGAGRNYEAQLKLASALKRLRLARARIPTPRAPKELPGVARFPISALLWRDCEILRRGLQGERRG